MIAGGFHVYRFLGLEHDGTALWWWWLGTLVKDFGRNLARADVGASDAMRVFLEVDHVPQGVHPKLNDDIHTHNHHSSGNRGMVPWRRSRRSLRVSRRDSPQLR